MADLTDNFLREQLQSRRARLASAATESREDAALQRLLGDVDAALARMEAGTYGLCETCHETVERDRLLADPLVRFCLDHLTSEEQRALEDDLQLAAGIQRDLLPPQGLSVGGWETAYHYRPRGPVSGDYCDLVVHENESRDLYFMLGDATGKGVAASMLMAHLHAILRTLVASALPPRELVGRASRLFCESTLSPYYATLICGKAVSSGEVELCNAGHCPAFWVRKCGEPAPLRAVGVPVGMFCFGDYSTEKVRVAAGETLFLYTDGLTEARSAGDEEYGEERLIEVLKKCRELPPAGMIQACLQDLGSFCSAVPPADDLTLMVIRRAS
jgi:phosphoserine phosphatase RsbU/P